MNKGYLTIWTNIWLCGFSLFVFLDFQRHFSNRYLLLELPLCNISLVQLKNENTKKEEEMFQTPKDILFILFFSLLGCSRLNHPGTFSVLLLASAVWYCETLFPNTCYHSVFPSLYAHWIHCISCIHNMKKKYFTEFAIHFSQRYRSSLPSFWHLYI